MVRARRVQRQRWKSGQTFAECGRGRGLERVLRGNRQRQKGDEAEGKRLRGRVGVMRGREGKVEV